MDWLLDFLPIVFLLLFVVVLGSIVRKDTEEQQAEWEKEEERKARVRALSPQPSYEERMGVQYGPTGEQDE